MILLQGKCAMMTIDGNMRDCARKWPDSVALSYYIDEEWEKISYTELAEAVDVIAHGLADLADGPDTKIALMCENRPEWVVSYLAILTAGAVAVPLDAQLAESEAEMILNHSETRVIICSMKCYEVIQRVLSETSSIRTVVVLDRTFIVRHDHNGENTWAAFFDRIRKVNRHATFMSYVDLREKGMTRRNGTPPPFPKRTLDDLCSIIYTSGTTGTPKGVMLAHRNILQNVTAIHSKLHMTTDDTVLLLLPLHHVLPFTGCFALSISYGASLCFVDIMSRARQKLIMEGRPTIMVGVPLLFVKMYRGVMREVEKSRIKSAIFKYGGKKIVGRAFKRKLGGRVRNMVCGGAPMDPEIAQGFLDMGIDFLEGYGLTETAPVIACNRPGESRAGTVGPPLPGVEVKIVDPDDEGVGEIAARGDNVMRGYFNNPDATRQAIRDGWIFTGDLGRLDSDGFLLITGRKKDMIVTRGGKNVYPDFIEKYINDIPIVAESVVIGFRTAGETGEDVGALVNPDYEMLLEHAAARGIALSHPMTVDTLTEDDRFELVNHYRDTIEKAVQTEMKRIPQYMRVTRIVVELEEFTKTSTKKIKRFLYRGRLDISDIDS